MSREKNRAEFPGLAALVDAFRAAGVNVKLIHGEENGKEIGKRPVDDPNEWSIDLMKPCLMEVDFSLLSKKRGGGR